MKALELDSTLAEAHTSRAWSKMVFDWDWQGAEREYRQAIELNPSLAMQPPIMVCGVSDHHGAP